MEKRRVLSSLFFFFAIEGKNTFGYVNSPYFCKFFLNYIATEIKALN